VTTQGTVPERHVIFGPTVVPQSGSPSDMNGSERGVGAIENSGPTPVRNQHGCTALVALSLPMQCVILDGGHQTRTAHRMTDRVMPLIPTPLVTVAGEPFVRHQLRLLHEGGVDDVVVCVGPGGESVEDEVTRHRPDGMTVRCSRVSTHLLGTAGALRRAVIDGLADERFMVLYAGSYLRLDFDDVWEWFDATHHLGLMTVWHNEDQFETSNVAVRNGKVVVYRKSSIRSNHPSMSFIDYGLSILTAEAVLDLVPAGEPNDLAALYSNIAAFGKLQAYEVDQRFHEIGSEHGLAELDRLLTRELQRWR
jgi:NDP-sugar pyrophosphorylase family protein